MCDFSYRHFDELIERCLELNYRFVTLDEITEGTFGGSRTVFLRHDVDHSLQTAADMAERERSLGVRSSYYFLLYGESDLLSAAGLAALRTIRECGHQIGLHYDVGFYDQLGLSVAEGINRDLTVLRSIAGGPVTSISPHNPTTTRQLTEAESRGVSNVHSVAGPRGYKYLSDSCQHWREGCLCGHIGRHLRLHVLIHPIWWRDTHMNLFDILELHRQEHTHRIDAAFSETAVHYKTCLLRRQQTDLRRL